MQKKKTLPFNCAVKHQSVFLFDSTIVVGYQKVYCRLLMHAIIHCTKKLLP